MIVHPKTSAARALRLRRSFLALAGAFLLAPAQAGAAASGDPQEEVTRNFQKSVALGTGQSVSVDHSFGQVRIHGEAGHDVKINATIRVQASLRSESESFADKIRIEVEPGGEGVRIRTVYPEEMRQKWYSFSGHKRISYSVNYDIAMPAEAPLRVKNSFGSIDATGIHGSAEIENSHGSLTVRDAGAVRLSNSFGSVELAGAAGNAFINDNNGSVQASDVKGTLEIRNRFGSIVARAVQGAATITGGNGSVELTDAHAGASVTTAFASVTARNIRGDLTVHDNNGNVDLITIGGAAQINNSFGNVSFTDVHGRVDCSTNNGRVKGSNLSGTSVTIRNSFGNIELENIAGSLDAETSNGKVFVRDARGGVSLKSSFGAIDASNIPKGIRAITGNGAVTLADIGGDAYAKTSFGSISIERISGNLTAENSNGSVTARNIKGDASVETSFGGVTLEAVGGRISVNNQNGAISVAAARPASGCRDISLKTSFSPIRVRIPDGVGYNLTARTSFGRVSTELPITSTGAVGGEMLSGTIGSGGCQLQLTDSNGNIEIAKAP